MTSTWDGGVGGLYLNLNTETTAKPNAGRSQSLNISKPGPKSTKVSLPDFPEMIADDEAQKVARKSALIIAKLKDGTMRAEVMANLDASGSGTTSKEMLSGVKAEIEYVQVLVVIDARANMNVSAISHKQFVEYVGTHEVASREAFQEVAMAKQFEFNVESYSLEAAEKEICRTLRLKDCQAWYVNDDNLARKRKVIGTDPSELAGMLRYDAISKMITQVVDEINVNKGRTAAYTGKGGDDTDKFLVSLENLLQKYKAPKFWIMLEKEFKDDQDKLVSSVCKYDSSSGTLSYCGTICLQVSQSRVIFKSIFNFIL